MIIQRNTAFLSGSMEGAFANNKLPPLNPERKALTALDKNQSIQYNGFDLEVVVVVILLMNEKLKSIIPDHRAMFLWELCSLGKVGKVRR